MTAMRARPGCSPRYSLVPRAAEGLLYPVRVLSAILLPHGLWRAGPLSALTALQAGTETREDVLTEVPPKASLEVPPATALQPTGQSPTV